MGVDLIDLTGLKIIWMTDKNIVWFKKKLRQYPFFKYWDNNVLDQPRLTFHVYYLEHETMIIPNKKNGTNYKA